MPAPCRRYGARASYPLHPPLVSKILVVDDESSIRTTVREIFEFEGHTVAEAKDGQEALRRLAEEAFDVVLCDVKMPRMDGIEVLQQAKREGLPGEFIMFSAHGTVQLAVEATKLGAFDFITKPPDLNRLLVAVRNAVEKKDLVQETVQLRQRVQVKDEMIGQGPALQEVRDTILRVAPTDARVLITGPNGAGKELVARAIHANSARAARPLVEVNCAAIPSELIESELFGHEKGSFTSAVKQRVGKFEQAHQATLFLDEIGDMSLSAQAKVLRALQEHRITRVGGEKDIAVDVRVLAATNKNLKEEIAAGRFREDLYHRLSVIVIRVPALADRRDDIPALAEHFLASVCRDYGMPPKTIAADALEYLQALPFTGNIRELRNVVERLVILSDKVITKDLVQRYAE